MYTREVPHYLYKKEITNFLGRLIEDQEVKDFDSLDEVNKDQLVSMGIKALGCDIDIFINTDANKHLANYLFSYDEDDKIELLKSIKESSYEKFSDYYNKMIEQFKDCDWSNSL